MQLGVASLVLGIFSIVFGVVPLLPIGGPALLTLAALGLPLGICGLALGLFSRGSAMRVQRELGVYTAGLSASVVGTLLCGAWIGGIYYMQRRVHQAAVSCQHDPSKCLGGQEQRPPAPGDGGARTPRDMQAPDLAPADRNLL